MYVFCGVWTLTRERGDGFILSLLNSCSICTSIFLHLFFFSSSPPDPINDELSGLFGGSDSDAEDFEDNLSTGNVKKMVLKMQGLQMHSNGSSVNKDQQGQQKATTTTTTPAAATSTSTQKATTPGQQQPRRNNTRTTTGKAAAATTSGQQQPKRKTDPVPSDAMTKVAGDLWAKMMPKKKANQGEDGPGGNEPEGDGDDFLSGLGDGIYEAEDAGEEDEREEDDIYHCQLVDGAMVGVVGAGWGSCPTCKDRTYFDVTASTQLHPRCVVASLVGRVFFGGVLFYYQFF